MYRCDATMATTTCMTLMNKVGCQLEIQLMNHELVCRPTSCLPILSWRTLAMWEQLIGKSVYWNCKTSGWLFKLKLLSATMERIMVSTPECVLLVPVVLISWGQEQYSLRHRSIMSKPASQIPCILMQPHRY